MRPQRRLPRVCVRAAPLVVDQSVPWPSAGTRARPAAGFRARASSCCSTTAPRVALGLRRPGWSAGSRPAKASCRFATTAVRWRLFESSQATRMWWRDSGMPFSGALTLRSHPATARVSIVCSSRPAARKHVRHGDRILQSTFNAPSRLGTCDETDLGRGRDCVDGACEGPTGVLVRFIQYALRRRKNTTTPVTLT